jgi:hypothetical protein
MVSQTEESGNITKTENSNITVKFCQVFVVADHIGNTGLWILASSFSIYSMGER